LLSDLPNRSRKAPRRKAGMAVCARNAGVGLLWQCHTQTRETPARISWQAQGGASVAWEGRLWQAVARRGRGLAGSAPGASFPFAQSTLWCAP
jgi:hypothetical protein